MRFLPTSGIDPQPRCEINVLGLGFASEIAIVMSRPHRTRRRNIVRLLLAAAAAIMFALALLFKPAPRPALAPHATLVLMVPFDHGLIVAADGRQTVNKIYCDGVAKIIQATKPARIVAAVTGNGVVVDYPRPVADDQICNYIKSAPRVFDIEAAVQRFLDLSSGPLKRANLEPLVQLCLGEVIKLDRTLPGFLARFLGSTMFQVVLAGYDADTGTSVVRTFSGRIEGDGSFVFQFAQDKSYSRESGADWLMFGEADYFNAHVLGPEGRPFYDRSIYERMKGHPVAEIDRDQAIALAQHSIGAAAKTTGIIPAATGIGGPIELLAITDEDKPERIGR